MEIIDKIIRAYKMLLANDAQLFVADANERSITHRFAIYLQEGFAEYDVDCEYNRNGLEAKKLESFKKTAESDDENAVTVYPDIIVHHRGTRDNLIVIEAKKTSNKNGDDSDKLEAYKSDLGYRFAFYVKFPVGEDFEAFRDENITEYITEIK
jgi:hypothetical protein